MGVEKSFAHQLVHSVNLQGVFSCENLSKPNLFSPFSPFQESLDALPNGCSANGVSGRHPWQVFAPHGGDRSGGQHESTSLERKTFVVTPERLCLQFPVGVRYQLAQLPQKWYGKVLVFEKAAGILDDVCF